MSAYRFLRVPVGVPTISTEYREILTAIPAPGTEEILARLDAVESRSMHGQLPIVWADAFDYSVNDIGGNEFLDFTSGIFVSNVGHGNLAVREAVEDVAFPHSYAYATEIRAAYLERLARWSGFDKAFLLSSGTEATEAALKLMRLYGAKTGRRGIVCLAGAFHGRTMGAQLLGAGGTWCGTDPDIFHLAPGSPMPEGVCGVMIEAFEGWSARFHDAGMVFNLARYCWENDILLCFDEMQSGFGRTGRKFGYEHYGVNPDLICVGKGMGGGYSLSGVLGRADVMDLPAVGEMSSTHGGNPVGSAAGLAVIDEIERMDLVNEAARKGVVLQGALCDLGLDNLSTTTAVHGKGLIAAIHFKTAEFASRVAERCMQKGLLVVATGRESIKIGPPLTIPDDALIEGVSVIAEAISELSKM